jgi:hypothetical protein
VDKLTFYEQVGIVIPGSVLLAGLLFIFPALNAFGPKEGVTLGQFGIFLLLSYATGHLVAAIGNVLESLGWKIAGGLPSNWVLQTDGNSLLNAKQLEQLAAKAKSRLGLDIEKVPGMEAKVWFPITRQIYADVAKGGKPQRVDTFNGNYGLNRGLAAATLALALVCATQKLWLIALGFLVVAIVYGYRAYRFAVYYARELYLQFLVMENTPTATSSEKK